MPALVVKHHRELVRLAHKNQELVEELLRDREIDERLKAARKELKDLKHRIDTFLDAFRQIVDDLEIGTGLHGCPCDFETEESGD
jgi:5-bromo-4-chloroindolyl phosphate hydrolysis protein